MNYQDSPLGGWHMWVEIHVQTTWVRNFHTCTGNMDVYTRNCIVQEDHIGTVTDNNDFEWNRFSWSLNDPIKTTIKKKVKQVDQLILQK